jgi:hypothetical protein
LKHPFDETELWLNVRSRTKEHENGEEEDNEEEDVEERLPDQELVDEVLRGEEEEEVVREHIRLKHPFEAVVQVTEEEFASNWRN